MVQIADLFGDRAVTIQKHRRTQFFFRQRKPPQALAKLPRSPSLAQSRSCSDDPSGTSQKNTGCNTISPEQSCSAASLAPFQTDPSARTPPPPANLQPPPHASLPNHFPRTPCNAKAVPAIPQSAFFRSSQSLSPLTHPELQRKPHPPLASRIESLRRLVLFAIDSAL